MKKIYIYNREPEVLLRNIIEEAETSDSWKYRSHSQRFLHRVRSGQYDEIYITHKIIFNEENNRIILEIKGSPTESQHTAFGNFAGFLMSHFEFSDVALKKQ